MKYASLRLYALAFLQGVEFEQSVFPEEVHGFLLHRNWLSAFRSAADFHDRHLRED